MRDDDSWINQKDRFPFFRFVCGFMLGACLTGYFCWRMRWVVSMPALAIATLFGGGIAGIATIFYGDAAWHWLLRR